MEVLERWYNQNRKVEILSSDYEYLCNIHNKRIDKQVKKILQLIEKSSHLDLRKVLIRNCFVKV